MDMDYILLIGAVVVGVSLWVLVTYLIYRRSIAILMTAIAAGCAVVGVIPAFILGREGITLARAAIALAVGLPILFGLMGILVRQIVNPAKQMAATATAIAEGDVNQQVGITRRDEIGDLADAFRSMIVYLQEMASAADLLAQGDLAADVTPRSGKDRLGNAFRQIPCRIGCSLSSNGPKAKNTVRSPEIPLTALRRFKTMSTNLSAPSPFVMPGTM